MIGANVNGVGLALDPAAPAAAAAPAQKKDARTAAGTGCIN